MGNELTIGSPVWMFDANRRVYAKDSSGRLTGSPIHREYWRQCKITGETSRSWIIDWWGKKLPKSDIKLPFGRVGNHRWWAISEEEVDMDCWSNSFRFQIIRSAERCSVQQLQEIAKIIDWTPPPKEQP